MRTKCLLEGWIVVEERQALGGLAAVDPRQLLGLDVRVVGDHHGEQQPAARLQPILQPSATKAESQKWGKGDEEGKM